MKLVTEKCLIQFAIIRCEKMTEPDDIKQMFRRFEYEMDVEKSRNTDELFRKFRYWIGREPSYKQKDLLEKYAKEHGIGIKKPEKPKPIGISKRKGVPREQLKRNYTVHKVRGKMVMVARIPKGMKGAGRFARRG
jgi:hypothetical protein